MCQRIPHAGGRKSKLQSTGDPSAALEYIPKRTQKPPLRRPVGDRENDGLKDTGKRACQCGPEVRGSADGVIAKGPASPCPQHERSEAVGPADFKDTMDAFPKEIP